MKLFLFVFVFLFSTPIFANKDMANYGWYVGLTAGTASDNGENNEQLKGASGGLLFGYRWVNWALELNYDYFSMKSNGGLSEFHYGQQLYIDRATLKGASTTFTLKGFFFRYFMVGLGLGSFSAEHDFKFHDPNNPNNKKSFEGDESYSAVFTQIGLVLPLYRHLDFRIYYEVRNVAGITPSVNIPGQYEPEPLSGTIKQFAGQIVYYFN